MAKVGGIKEAEGSANSLEVDNLAKFAVDEHNKKEVFFPLFSLSHIYNNMAKLLCLILVKYYCTQPLRIVRKIE